MASGDYDTKITVGLEADLSGGVQTEKQLEKVRAQAKKLEQDSKSGGASIEQAFGKYEGTPRDSEEFRTAKMRFIDSYDGGESMFHAVHRIYSLLDEITSQEDTVYLIAAHNGLARIIQSYFRDMTNDEYASFGIRNCEIIRFDY